MLYESYPVQVEGSDFDGQEVLAYVVKEDLKDSLIFLLPKSVFNDLFKPVATPLERIKLELLQLTKRIEELNEFIRSEEYSDLKEGTRDLINRQLDAMCMYQNCLQQRYDSIRLNPTFNSGTESEERY